MSNESTIELPYKLGAVFDPTPVSQIACGLEECTTVALPKPKARIEPPNVQWPMADNDRLGCCTIAAEVHVEQAGAAITGEPWTYPGDAAVQTVYEKLTGGPDTGLMLSQVLKPWHKPGLFGTENDGYASVNPKNTNLVKLGIEIFGAEYIAVNLPEVAMQQFKPDGSGVWELTGTDADYQIAGGHCIVPVGYTAEGVIAVTWGSIVLITWKWWFTYVTQVFAVIPHAFVEKGGDARGFNLSQIKAFLPAV